MRNVFHSFSNFKFLFLIFFLFSVSTLKAQVNVTGASAGNGSYSTLGSALTAIATSTGTINIEITGNTTEASSGASLSAGPWTSVTISPTGGPWTISGAVTAASPLITLNGSDNVIINGNDNLIFSNTTVSSTSGTSTMRLVADATNNTFNNVTFMTASTMSAGTNGGAVWISTGTTSGNDNNSFQSCKFSSSTSNSGVLFYSNGSTTNATIQNSNVTVNNCEFYDYFLASGTQAGIYVSTGNTAFSITNNKIYQSAPRTITTSSTVYGIYCVNAGATALGENFVITGNTIGYNNNAGSGTMTYTAGSTAGGFVGINFNGSNTSTGTNNVNNNIVSNIQWTSAGASIFTGISTANSSTTVGNTLNVNNNQIKNITSVTATGNIIAISTGYTPSVSISSNTIDNITRSGAGVFYGINYTGSSTSSHTFNSNTITNLSNTSSTNSSAFYGIYSVSSPATEIWTNNLIDGMTSNSTANQSINGIYNLTATTGSKTCSGNIVRNLSLPINSAGNLYGLRIAYLGNNNSINNNTVYNLNGGTLVWGMAVGQSAGIASANTNVNNNKVYDLSTNKTDGAVVGIQVGPSQGISSTTNVYNNLIGNLSATGSTTVEAIRGININSTAATSGINVSFNTIYISGAGGTDFNTSGIYQITSTTATTANLTLRNNIIYNNCTASGAGVTAAFKRNLSTGTNYNSASDRNIYFGGPTSTTQLLYFDGTNSAQNLTLLQSFVGGADVNSYEENVAFLSTVGSSADFLKFDAATPSFAESGGVNISGITNDFGSVVRQGNGGYAGTGSAPDVGGRELEGTVKVICTGTPASATISGSASVCLNASTSLSLSTLYSDIGITYQWASSTTMGGPYLTMLGTSATQATGNLTVPTYFICTITCTNSGMTMVTTEKSVTINSLPTVMVSPSSGTICLPGGAPIMLTASGASTYAWSPVTGLSASTGAMVDANPTGTTSYTVTGSDGNGCIGTAIAVITVNPKPTLGLPTAIPTTICSGDNSQLSANATLPLNTLSFSSGSGASLETILSPTTVTTVSAGTIDDGSNGITPSPSFSFTFDGVIYSDFSASTNGWLKMGISAASTTIPTSLTNTASNGVFAFARDANLNPTNAGNLIHGAAAGGKYVFQFTKNAGATGGAESATIYITAQVVLWGNTSATPGKIEIIYESSLGTPATGAAIGVANAAGQYINAVTGNSTALTLATAYPVSGIIYTFTPATITYAWTPSTFLSNPSISNPLASAVTATTEYMVTASANGCTSALDSVTVTVSAGASIDTPPSADTKCVGQTSTFTVAASGPSITYQWRKDGIDIPVGTNASAGTNTLILPNVMVGDAAMYDVVVTSTCGSPVTTSAVALVVNTLPTVTVSPTSGLICLPGGTPITLMASGTASTYAWTPTTGLSASTGTTVDANPTAPTSYTVTGSDTNGCTNTATTVINVTLTPQIINATATPTNICSGGSSTLTALTSIPITANIGTQTTTLATTGSPYRSGAGIGFEIKTQLLYTAAELTAAGLVAGPITELGFTTTTTTGTLSNFEIRIGSSPATLLNATFQTSSTTLVFTQASFMPVSGINMHTFNAGTFTWDGVSNILVQTCQTNTAPLGTSTVAAYNPGFISNVQVASATGCSSLTGTTSTNKPIIRFKQAFPLSLNWMPGNLMGSPQVVTPATTTIYTVTADNAGCTATSTVTVNVVPLSCGSITAPLSICANSNFTLTSSATGGGEPYTYLWSDGAGTTTANLTQNLAAGMYTYTVTVTDGCSTSCTSSITVTVNPKPTAAAISNTPVCSGLPLNLNGTTDAGPGATFAWTGPNTYTAAIEDPTIAMVTVAATGTYSFTATSAAGCASDPATTVVLINQSPSALVITQGSAVSKCAAAPAVELNATGGTIGSTATIGTGIVNPGTTSYPNPFSAYYGGAKHQMIYTNSELSGQGLSSGSVINVLALNISAFVGNACTNLTIRMKHTSLTTLTGIETGMTDVYGPTTFTPSATGWSTFSLTSNFTWNGSDNIIIEFVHNAGNGGNGSGTRTFATDMGSNMTYYVAKDNVAGGIAGFDAEPTYTISSGSISRPNVQLGFGTPVNKIWSPTTGLFTDAGGMNAYMSTNLATVFAAPAATQIYTVTATSAAGCTATNSINVFIEGSTVTSSANAGPGTLRAALACVLDGGTIMYDQPTTTTTVLTALLTIDKNVTIMGASASSRPEITTSSSGISIDAMKTLTLKDVDVKSTAPTQTFTGAGDVSITGTTVGKQ